MSTMLGTMENSGAHVDKEFLSLPDLLEVSAYLPTRVGFIINVGKWYHFTDLGYNIQLLLFY